MLLKNSDSYRFCMQLVNQGKLLGLMNSLIGKKVVLGVTGGIAAYKTPELVRRMTDAGAEVRVVMTQAAALFVTPITLQTVSNHPVYQSMFNGDSNAMEHIDLARWADIILIAPATAHIMARLSHGFADDLLTTLCLAAEKPIALAPAMNRVMWSNAATQSNVDMLRRRGMLIWGPGQGAQACGETGEGRMLEPAELVQQLITVFQNQTSLSGKTVLITAGPTREAIDPVRYISNQSSGKMGYALARAARDAGARIILVSGPTAIAPPAGVDFIGVTSAQDMFDAVKNHAPQSDIFIAAAAVADYRPKVVADEKIKKKSESLRLELVRNPDILAEIAQSKPKPFCVGFAAESQNLEAHAKQKLAQKKLDMIAANWVGSRGAQLGTGFDTDDNALLVITADKTVALDKAPKTVLAQQLLDLIVKAYEHKNST
jgi:phosphopantothenoylcysteine decarboxylase/phosphopantothenate--cysteine ligase